MNNSRVLNLLGRILLLSTVRFSVTTTYRFVIVCCGYHFQPEQPCTEAVTCLSDGRACKDVAEVFQADDVSSSLCVSPSSFALSGSLRLDK